MLARKYRPSDFSELIGQQALVQTLTNAIRSGRLAHAFMLTGVRGVGKTTTARIIARALNCIGEDGKGGPTAEPCGVCENCVAIASDRHVDVIEMDAASRTGVDDIRELIEGVRYRPVSARYKVYIIDEVHMLSKNAFNALLKTLEEPPEHVKFIFATTEIRKVPVTVLSRCQRFDLRRIDMETLTAHYKSIVENEGAKVSDDALALVARAADGSVRDGLSLLDQAIAHASGEVGADQVRDMLGLADRARTFDLLEDIFKGDAAATLGKLEDQYKDGADPVSVLQDLLETCHWITRIKVTPGAAQAPGVPEIERTQGKELAERLTMADLTRAWQMLLKGLGEAREAPSALKAVEMVLVRLIYGLSLPSPAEALQKLENTPSQSQAQPQPASAPAQGSGGGGSHAAPASPQVTHGPNHGPNHGPTMSGGGQPQAQLQRLEEIAPQPASMSELQLPDPATFEDVVSLTESKSEMILHANLVSNVHLVNFELGRIEYSPTEHAPRDLAQKLTKFLNDHTSRRWVVSVSKAAGQSTLKQQGDAVLAKERGAAAKHPLVAKVLEVFPGAEVKKVTTIAAPVDENPGEPD